MIEKPIDIALSHDWPRGIAASGNIQELLKVKPFFEEDIKSNKFGSPVVASLCNQLKSRYWFSGHCHVDFKAKSPNGTLFRACDKVNDKRGFLAIEEIHVPVDFDRKKGLSLRFETDWLGILSSTIDMTWKGTPSNLFSYHGVTQTYNLTPKGTEFMKSQMTAKKIAAQNCIKRGLDIQVPDFSHSEEGELPNPGTPDVLEDTAPTVVNPQTKFLLAFFNCLIFHAKDFLYVDSQKDVLSKRKVENSDEIELDLSDCEDDKKDLHSHPHTAAELLEELKDQLSDDSSEDHSQSQTLPT